MKLVDLVPLKEDLSRASMEELEALARQAQDIQDSEAGYAQQQGDFDIDKFGNEFADEKVMPYGGEYYSMNDIQDAIATRLDKSGDVPYDVAIGRMTQDEYDKYMSTVAKDKDTFTKSSKFDRMNENKESIAAKWDSIDTGRELEKNDVKQFNANVAAKVELLQQLRADGKLKKDYSDDKIENWSISASLPGTKIAGLLKPEANEGSCGYSQDAPGGEELDTPGGTQGMDADDRTRGMLKKLIQKEIAKLHEMPVGKGDMNPAFKINPSKVPGTAAWDKRAGLTVGGDSKDKK